MYGIRNPNQKQPKPSEPTKVKDQPEGKGEGQGVFPERASTGEAVSWGAAPNRQLLNKAGPGASSAVAISRKARMEFRGHPPSQETVPPPEPKDKEETSEATEEKPSDPSEDNRT